MILEVFSNFNDSMILNVLSCLVKKEQICFDSLPFLPVEFLVPKKITSMEFVGKENIVKTHGRVEL